MSHEDIAALVSKKPFSPFRMFLTDGTFFDVRHPEMCMLGKRSLVLGIGGDPSSRIYDRMTYIDLLHIMRCEPFEATVQH